MNNLIYVHSKNLELNSDEILKGLQNIKFKNTIIVLDSIRDFTKELMNDKDVIPIMNYLKKMRDNGATVIFLHHISKTGAEKQEAKGSTAFRDSIDSAYFLKSRKDDNTITFSLLVDKDRVGVLKNANFKLDMNNKRFEKIDSEIEFVSDEEKIFIKRVKEVLNVESLNQSKLLERLGKTKYDKNAKEILKKYNNILWTSSTGLHNSLIFKSL